MSRRALSKTELDLAKTFRDDVLNSDRTSFACGGVIPSSLIKVDDLVLYYQDISDEGGQEPNGRLCAKFPLDEEAALAIYDAGSPSPFGRGQETVLDEGYRQAHEIKPPNFALTDGLVATSGVLSTIIQTLGGTMKLRSSLSKLNAYTQGGFFKPHRDTPLGETHVGTLMFCLPAPFSGGDLVVRHNGNEVIFDWANQVVDKNNKHQITWGFLYSDVEHEVLPVTRGTRITLAYDVFRLQTSDLAPAINARPILYGLQNLIQHPSSFLPEGGQIAIGLAHGYPSAGSAAFKKNLPNYLKGQDAAVLDAIRSLGLSYQLIAVYPFDDWEPEPEGDEEDMSLLSKDWTCNDVLVSDSFECGTCDYQWEGCQASLVEEQGGESREDYVWLRLSGGCGYQNSFVSYGNEATLDYMYVGAAIVVTLPKEEDRRGLLIA